MLVRVRLGISRSSRDNHRTKPKTDRRTDLLKPDFCPKNVIRALGGRCFPMREVPRANKIHFAHETDTKQEIAYNQRRSRGGNK
jgi:hypothetical protein